MIRRARSLLLLGGMTLPALTSAAVWAEPPVEWRFSRLDRTYSSFVEDVAPIEVGGLSITLESPEHSMSLQAHAVELTALSSSEYRTRVDLVFAGAGRLVADLEMGLVKNLLEDEITLPVQALSLEGITRIASRPDGYDLTLVESFEDSAEVRIESRLAGRIVPLCRQLALVLIDLHCEALEEALSKVVVPIPAPGTEFFLDRAELTEEEAAAFDAYLERGSRPVPDG